MDEMHDNGIRSQWKYVLLAGVFAVFAAAVVLSDSFRVYEADVTVLPIAKGTSISSGEAGETLIALSKTDTFFSDLVAENENSYGFGKEDFRDILSVEKSEEGGVLHVRVSAKDPDIARDLSRKASLSLFRFVGRYYDVHAAADFRIIDGPSVSARIPSPIAFVFSSTAAGLSVTALFFGIVYFLAPAAIGFAARAKQERLPQAVLSPEIFEPARPESPFLASENQGLNREEIASGIEERSGLALGSLEKEKHAAIPMNLPSFSDAEERFFQEFSFEGEEGDKAPEEEESHTKIEAAPESIEPKAPVSVEEDASEEAAPEEPTQEEYRNRLNELLRG